MGVMCTICRKLFSCQSNLNRHTRTAHKAAVKIAFYELDKYSAKCRECNCSYRYVADLREHLEKYHKIDFETVTMFFKSMQGECFIF